MNGYEALRESAAWIDLSARGKICVNGDDRARLLHAITTNHIQQLTPGTGCYVFFLNAQGRVLADANILCREDHLLLDTEPEIRERIYAHLDHYIIAAAVTLEDTAARTTTLAVEGPRSAEVLARIGAPVPEADYAFVPWGSRLVARLSSTGSPGFFVFAPVDEQPALIAQPGIEQADAEAARIVRLEHGKPGYGEDITDCFLAQETNQSHALHFSKGCYLGQEIVERVRTRAQLHRRLMPLDIDCTTAPSSRNQAHHPRPRRCRNYIRCIFAGARKSRRSRLRSHGMMAKSHAAGVNTWQSQSPQFSWPLPRSFQPALLRSSRHQGY